MRKIRLILSIVLAVISAPTMAQNDTYACQYIRAGGLQWENEQWMVKKFNLNSPFFLKVIDSNLNIDSASKVFKNISKKGIMCHPPFNGRQSCSSFAGTTLSFNFNTMNGGVSNIFGATQSDNDVRKDSLSVEPFTCTKM